MLAKITCAVMVTAVGMAIIPSVIKKTQATITKRGSAVTEELLSNMGPEIVRTSDRETEQ